MKIYLEKCAHVKNKILNSTARLGCGIYFCTGILNFNLANILMYDKRKLPILEKEKISSGDLIKKIGEKVCLGVWIFFLFYTHFLHSNTF